MPSAEFQPPPPSRHFWLLAGFLVIVFLTGGSSKPDVQSLQWLRPIAIMVAAYAIFSMRRVQWVQYRHPILVIAAIIILTVCHLVPLSPDIWQRLPGREVIASIDSVTGIQNPWRPFSMVPLGTANALYSLSIPIAAFGLAVQLGPQDHVRLLSLLIGLVIISGALGVLQAIGLDLALYGSDGEIAGLFANRNHQGILLAGLFPMLAVATVVSDRIGLRGRFGLIVMAGLAVINIPLIIVTGSRAGLIGALLAVLFIPLIGSGGQSARSRRSTWAKIGKFALPVATIAVLVWLTVFTSRETALTRFQTAEDDVRYPVWTSIVDMLHVYMPWGSGIGSYAEVYQILEPDGLLRATFSNHAHNEWLEVALTAGVPGMAIVVWVAILALFALKGAFGAKGLQGLFSRLGIGLMLLLAFASTFDYPLRTPIMASVLAIAAVWAASFRRFGNEDGCR